VLHGRQLVQHRRQFGHSHAMSLRDAGGGAQK
jgi:hypothetical protein